MTFISTSTADTAASAFGCSTRSRDGASSGHGFPRRHGCGWTALAAFVLTFAAPVQTARADTLDDFLSTLSTLGVIDPAVVEAKPMIQCLIDGKAVQVCAEQAAGQAHGLIPNDPKIKKVIDIFEAVQDGAWLDVFMLAGEQVVCSFVPGGSVKDLFCGEIFDVAEPVITAAYEAVMDGDILALVSAVGVEYACDLIPEAPGATELCGVLGEIIGGIADGVGMAIDAFGSLAEDIAGQSGHMPVEEYYLKYWRTWITYVVQTILHEGKPSYGSAGNYAMSSTSCVQYFDSHKMSESNANKVCGIMRQRLTEEAEQVVQVVKAYPPVFFKGWGAPRVPVWTVAYAPMTDPSIEQMFYRLHTACVQQFPVKWLPSISPVVDPMQVKKLGTTHGWTCKRAKELMSQALSVESVNIQALIPKLNALGCKGNGAVILTSGIHVGCSTYEAFRACEAIYPGGESQQESLCWINGYSAEAALAKQVAAELGEKRCRTVEKPYNTYELFDVQCDRPWKQANCESLIATLTEGAHKPSIVSCLLNVDAGFAKAKSEAAAIVKELGVSSSGMGSVDPETGATSGLSILTQPNCQRADDDEWDPLRIHCKSEPAKKELAASLPTCDPDPNKDGADKPCYDGPLTLDAPVEQHAMASPGFSTQPNHSPIIDVEIDFFDRGPGGWVATDQPSLGGLVAVRCLYEHEPRPAIARPTEWSIAFLEGDRLLREPVEPGPVDTAGRAVQTWYGRLLAPGAVELGCARAIGGKPDASIQRLRTVEVPAPPRSAPRQHEGPRIAAALPAQAASARGARHATDLRFSPSAGIKRTGGRTVVGEAPTTTTASVGERLLVDCSYLVSLDALNGEVVKLEQWKAVIEQHGKTLANLKGDRQLIGGNGSSGGGLSYRFIAKEPGDLEFRCRLDPDGAVAETDETNNEVSLKLTVSGARPAP